MLARPRPVGACPGGADFRAAVRELARLADGGSGTTVVWRALAPHARAVRRPVSPKREARAWLERRQFIRRSRLGYVMIDTSQTRPR
jgi:hypothetical protein